MGSGAAAGSGAGVGVISSDPFGNGSVFGISGATTVGVVGVSICGEVGIAVPSPLFGTGTVGTSGEVFTGTGLFTVAAVVLK